MDRSAAVLPLQSPKDVSVSEIEQELNKVWMAHGENAAARAATFTLIVYESLDSSLLSPSNAVEAIATQNPCRVIDLRAKVGSADQAVEAQVAAYCPVNRQQKSALVCCEYITLQAPESAFVRIHSTVTSLLIPDLPTFLWWQGDLDLNSLLFQQLVNLSNRVIVDSRTFLYPEEDLGEVHMLTQEGRQFGDLNWKRLSSWQELTAQAYDPPDRRQALLTIDRVTIDYKAGNPCQAYLFLGWLASRLQWDPTAWVQKQEHDYLIDRITFVSSDQRTIEAELAAVPIATDSAHVGDLIGLKLTSSQTQGDTTVLCSETTGCMRMESGGGAQASSWIHQVSPIEHNTIELLLAQQLQLAGQDRLFEESLAVVNRILPIKQS
ncbi:MAG: glucose-6-phosphate dehydrogenase assembly protein OpcA [Cyanobacteriota bacterium]|nr:glucose-6-phosphate dehydrogenase assembly protein OpcA [Cyanobacteriota bacterium]